MAAADITIKKGEGKTLTFTISRAGAILDVSSSTARFVIKNEYDDTTYLLDKADSDFDKTDGALGILKVNLTATNTDTVGAGTFKAELRVIVTADTDVDKSETWKLKIEDTLYHN